MGESKLLQKFQEVFSKRAHLFADTISTLIGFIFLDMAIKTFFFKPDSIFSLKFLINTIMFLGLVLIYYQIIINWLSKLIESLLQKEKDKAAWIVLGTIFLLVMLFHYKYQLLG